MKFKVLFVTLWWFANVQSKGSPWDWQSVNAKYPVYRGGGNGLEALNSLEAAYNRVGILEANQLNVTTRVDDSALLPCMVKNLGQYTVSWLRGHDTSVLTFGEVTFSSDQRFKVIHTPGRPASNWSLQINQINFKDGGWYDCQVNTEPKVSSKVHLKVVAKGASEAGLRRFRPAQKPDTSTSSSSHPLFSASGWPSTTPLTPSEDNFQGSPKAEEAVAKLLQDDSSSLQVHNSIVPQINQALHPRGLVETTIHGPSDLSVSMGETLVLECSVTNLLLPPSKLSWSHVRERSSGGGREVSADFKRGVSLESERLAGESHTRMVVSSVRPGDAGTYLCQADSFPPAKAIVKVNRVVGRGNGRRDSTLFFFASSSSSTIKSSQSGYINPTTFLFTSLIYATVIMKPSS